jgi:pseudouridine-5'-monophosphatase
MFNGSAAAVAAQSMDWMTPQPGGCLFDLDGLLLNTEPIHAQAWREAIRHFGGEASEELLLSLRGRNKYDNARAVITSLKLPISSDELLAQQQPRARAKVGSAAPMPGAIDLVERCRVLAIPMAIATSSSQQAATLKLDPHSWLEPVTVRVYGDDPSISAGKPAPDLFLEAARRLGVPPQECWAFEDAVAGAEAAVAAGCRVFVVPAPGLGAHHYPDAVTLLERLDDLEL